MRKQLIFAMFLLTVFFFGIVHAEDTGTYRILNHKIVMVPHADGNVEIHYYQRWLVTGGHIPWITVGLPNDHFAIKQFGLAVKKIAPANEGGWSGVRIDLDKDYRPNDTLEVSFSVVQQSLFYADKENYKLDFTPGWYDRAFTDELTIGVRFFVPLNKVVANPRPTTTVGDTIVWRKTSLGKGERLTISFSFPQNILPKKIDSKNMKSTGGASAALIIIIIIAAIVILVIVIGVASEVGGGGGYSGGGIWSGGSGGGGLSSGGGGGFGGGGGSCACACVSCACACACAGGGGAGCSLKKNHSCSICHVKEKDHDHDQAKQ
jgi:hypothetical protein